MSNKVPLKVTARLARPLAGNAPQLDALLLYAAAPRDFFVDRSMPAPPQTIDLPIDCQWLGEWNVWKCSSPIVRTSGRAAVDYYNRRTPTEASELLDPKRRVIVATTNSPTKSYRLPLKVQPVREVVWFAVGERKGTLGMLRRNIRAIGKKVSYGYGLVKEWTVEVIDQELSWFSPAGDKRVLMRHLPLDRLADDVVGYRRDFAGVAPPYWHPERQTEIITPC